MRIRAAVICCLFAVSLTGCVSSGYNYGVARSVSGPELAEDQIERGKPNILIDGVGWIVGIPGKILLLDGRVENHHISAETEEAIVEYLDKNDLTTTKVRLNQYDPLGEWRRLTQNKQVGAGWRYTFGTISTIGYTLLPGRIFGGDNFNPYTNTISLYSDHPAIALHEGGHAKDILGRSLPGTYSAAYSIPFVGLYHEERATSDALSYLAAEDRPEELKDAYKILYPAYATHVGGQFSRYLPPPFSTATTLACVVPGHIAGRIKAAGVESRETLADANPFGASPSVGADSGVARVGFEAQSELPVPTGRSSMTQSSF